MIIYVVKKYLYICLCIDVQSVWMTATSYFVNLYKEIDVTFFFHIVHSLYQF